MGAARTPRSTGVHAVNVNDGTMARCASPDPKTTGDEPHSHSHARKRPHKHSVRLTFHGRKAKTGEAAASNSEGLVWQQSRDPFVAVLYGFDIGRAELKAPHEEYLDKLAADIARQSEKVWNICLEGRASRTGKDGDNLSLSRQRAISVQWRLSSRAPGVTIKADWVGEELAAKEGDRDGKENAIYRAVSLRVWSKDKPKPQPIDLKRFSHEAIPNVKLKKEFKIRLSRAFSGSGLGLVYDKAIFVIWDVDKKVAAEYVYSGPGIGKGKGLEVAGFAGSLYGGGDWSSFHTPKSWTLENFIGSASLGGVSADSGFGGPSRGWTRFEFRQIEHWYSPFGTLVVINDLDTGESIALPSVGVSVSSGFLEMQRKPFPYIGP